MKPQFLIPTVLSGGLRLPYSVDFTALGNGNLPSTFRAETTWQITTGAAVCIPVTLGSELLTDPGLEANYTGGLCDTLTEVGSGSYAEETVDMHGGASAQECTFAAIGDHIHWPNISSVNNKYYIMSVWNKQTTELASPRPWFTETGDSTNYYSPDITSSWAQYVTGRIGITALQLQGCREVGGTGDVVLVDDGSVKQLTTGELIAMLPPTSADVTVKAGITRADIGYMTGVIARADSRTNPQSYLLAMIYVAGSSVGRAALYKVVNGTVTHLDSGNITYGAGNLLEIRCDGSTIKLYYDGSQEGGDQTVSDAEILNNKIHGFISTGGGNSLDSFFVT